MYAVIWAGQQAHPFDAEDQHDLAFFLAGSCFFQFNPAWLQEIESFDCLTTFLVSEQPAIPATHFSLLFVEMERLTKRFNFGDATQLLMAAAHYRLRCAGELAEEHYWPNVVREFRYNDGPLTIVARVDPTIDSKAQRFPLTPVAATLFIHYLSHHGGGTLSYSAALDRLEVFPPPHMGERQLHKNLDRFSCLLDPPYCRL